MNPLKNVKIKRRHDRKVQGVQSVEIGLRIARLLVDYTRPMTLTELATAGSMSPSKMFRYLVSLSRAGIVERGEHDGRYSLGELALRMGLAAIGRLDSHQYANSEITRLRDEIDKTIVLAVWNGKGAVIVRWLDSSHPVTVNVRTGTVLSPIRSPSGRLFSAFLPGGEVDTAIRAEWATGASFTYMGKPLSRAKFETLLAEDRERGLARVRGDVVPGIDGISAPVFNHQNRIVMTFTAVGPHRGIDISWTGAIARAVKKAAMSVSRRLGWSG